MAAFFSSLFAFLAPSVQADAVISANDTTGLIAAVSSGGRVTFTSGGTFTMPQTLYVTRDTVIDGSSGSTVIKGNGSNRVFYVNPGVRLTLLQLSVNSGKDQIGAGIYNAGTVLLSNCTFSANIAAGADGVAGPAGETRKQNGQNGTDALGGYGGAIFNAGTVLGTNVTFANNSAKGGAGGAGGAGVTNANFGGNGGSGGIGGYAFGGAIFNSGSIYLTNASFSGNSAVSGNGGTNGAAGPGAIAGSLGNGGAGGSAGGGAIYSSGSLRIYGASMTGNSAAGGNSQPAGPNLNARPGGLAVGGAIYSTGNLVAHNSTLAANSVKGGSGGAGAGGSFPRNGATGGDGIGGAICNAYSATLSFCTIAGNLATNGVGGAAGTGAFTAKAGSRGAILGANVANVSGYCVMDDTIMAYPTGGGFNCYGAVIDGGYNISSDLTGAAGGLSRRNLDPLLNNVAVIGANRTATMTLKAGSPAINRGKTASFPPTDQIGQTRLIPDIGAYEYTLYYNIYGSASGSTQSSGGIKIFVTRASAPTNSFVITASTNGSYTVTGLLPGNYTLSVTNRDLIPRSVDLIISNSDITGINFGPADAPIAPPPQPFADATIGSGERPRPSSSRKSASFSWRAFSPTTHLELDPALFISRAGPFVSAISLDRLNQ